VGIRLRSCRDGHRYASEVSERARAAALRLLEAMETGEVAALCGRAHVELVLFGSAAIEDADPADLDVAVAFDRDSPGDVLGLLDELYLLTGYEDFDVLDLDRAGPLARERALVGCRLLFQARAGLFANRQIAAIMERLDTDEMRRLQLELMAR
jgi:predicted nucleotidyltransferase